MAFEETMRENIRVIRLDGQVTDREMSGLADHVTEGCA